MLVDLISEVTKRGDLKSPLFFIYNINIYKIKIIILIFSFIFYIETT